MKYILITNHSEEFFLKNVNDKISEGWKPQGGVSISRDRRQGLQGMIFSQALIKE